MAVQPLPPNIGMILLPIHWTVMSSDDTINLLSAHVVFLIKTGDQSLIGGAGRWVDWGDYTIKK